jgi:hypothetical protein
MLHVPSRLKNEGCPFVRAAAQRGASPGLEWDSVRRMSGRAISLKNPRSQTADDPLRISKSGVAALVQ